MKKMTRKMLVGAVAIALAGGAYLNYLQGQCSEKVSDLTLANIEAMAFDPSGGETGIFWGNCVGDGQICSTVCPKCKAVHYTSNIGYGIIEGGYCDNCLYVYPK